MSGTKDAGRSKMTAAELMALKAERLGTDRVYRAQTEAVEAERQARVTELRRAEQPIVEDLRNVGVEVSSVWDLVNTADPYPRALPVLLRHLQRGGYPDRVMESLGRALAVRPSAFVWDTLRQLYLAAQGRGEEEGLAVALAASATPEDLDQLIALLDDSSRSSTRIHFLDEPTAKVHVGPTIGLSRPLT